jgi:hypothetical protein
MQAPPRLSGFISYAHDDAKHFTSLQKHLVPIERLVGVSFWTDHDLRAGQVWNDKIAAAIVSADVFIVLCSVGAFASDYIFRHELPAIRRQKVDHGKLVVPVVLEQCSWQAFVGSLQVVPTDTSLRVKPILRWQPQQEGFHQAATQALKAIATHFSITPTGPFDWIGGSAP